MSQFIHIGNKITVNEANNIEVSKNLRPGTYLVQFDKMEGFFLKTIENFKPCQKVYGDFLDKKKRIIDTFMTRKDVNTGILLSGLKGTGKTLLTKALAYELLETYSYSTIIVNGSYNPEALSEFLRKIDIPAMIIFDEFDKSFASASNKNSIEIQNGFLSILDGIFSSKKLFVFVANEKNMISSYLTNRPGRIFYHYKFDSINSDIIKEYCEDNLINKDYIGDIISMFTFIPDPSFDILKAIVEESNRYNERPAAFIHLMNINYGIDGYYDITLCNKNTGEVYCKSNSQYVKLDPTHQRWEFNTDEIVLTEALKPLLFNGLKGCKNDETGEMQYNYEYDGSYGIDESDFRSGTYKVIPPNELYLDKFIKKDNKNNLYFDANLRPYMKDLMFICKKSKSYGQGDMTFRSFMTKIGLGKEGPAKQVSFPDIKPEEFECECECESEDE